MACSRCRAETKYPCRGELCSPVERPQVVPYILFSDGASQRAAAGRPCSWKGQWTFPAPAAWGLPLGVCFARPWNDFRSSFSEIAPKPEPSGAGLVWRGGARERCGWRPSRPPEQERTLLRRRRGVLRTPAKPRKTGKFPQRGTASRPYIPIRAQFHRKKSQNRDLGPAGPGPAEPALGVKRARGGPPRRFLNFPVYSRPVLLYNTLDWRCFHALSQMRRGGRGAPGLLRPLSGGDGGLPCFT